MSIRKRKHSRPTMPAGWPAPPRGVRPIRYHIHVEVTIVDRDFMLVNKYESFDGRRINDLAEFQCVQIDRIVPIIAQVGIHRDTSDSWIRLPADFGGGFVARTFVYGRTFCVRTNSTKSPIEDKQNIRVVTVGRIGRIERQKSCHPT